MDAFVEKLKEIHPEVHVKQDELLLPYTSFKCGGHARYIALIDNLETLSDVAIYAWENGVAVRVVGGGTNILVPDDGFDGLVIKNNCRRFDLQGMRGRFTNNQMKLSQGYLYAESGALMNQVVRYVIDQGFGGIEYSLGLPGTVGGAVAVNSNFPKENIRIGRAVYAAKILTKDGGIKDVDSSYFHFSPERSRILADREIILSLLFALYPDDKTKLWKRAEEAVSYRTTTQPKQQLTGMTFRNVQITCIYPNSSLPSDVTYEFLLEKAGILGFRVGNVEIWPDNPRYILNRGNGTEEDVKQLIAHIKTTILRRFGVQLDIQLHSIT
ncbi:MAG: FAD-binding protein [Candidatus Levybacteria bacterium]|nr:FAD-binding protein [Candidatus Levybacteria bacterium]